MTTIFASAKEGVMVCDSRCTEGDIWYPMTKVRRIGDELIGIAGSVREASLWLKWYESGKKGARPKLESFGAVILRRDGLYGVSADAFEMLIERGFHGIGSGGSCAIAAYMGGADAKKAVNIAIQIDALSGGDVVVHRLKEK